MSDDIRDATVSFEAVKTSMTQTKTGFILRLAMHPNDVPTALVQDWVGTRYVVAMTRLGDDDAPQPSEYQTRANRAIQSAGMLARNDTFHAYLDHMGEMDSALAVNKQQADDDAAAALRTMCGVQSRKEFSENKDALAVFERLRDDFEYWRKTNLV